MFQLGTQSHNNGFTMTFENGYTVSVRWGWGNYCDNYHKGPVVSGAGNCFPPLTSSEFYECKTAEVAVWDFYKHFVSSPGVAGDVRAEMSSDDVAKLLADVATWKYVPVQDSSSATE